MESNNKTSPVCPTINEAPATSKVVDRPTMQEWMRAASQSDDPRDRFAIVSSVSRGAFAACHFQATIDHRATIIDAEAPASNDDFQTEDQLAS